MALLSTAAVAFFVLGIGFAGGVAEAIIGLALQILAGLLITVAIYALLLLYRRLAPRR